MISRIVMVGLTLVFMAGYRQVTLQANDGSNGFDLVGSAGNIRRPTGYRDRDQGLGTYTVLRSTGNEMHVVYASPGTAE